MIFKHLNSIRYAMNPDFESSLRATERCTRERVGIKSLAGGRLNPRVGFRYVYCYVDSVAVGIASEIEMREAYTVARDIYASKP